MRDGIDDSENEGMDSTTGFPTKIGLGSICKSAQRRKGAGFTSVAAICPKRFRMVHKSRLLRRFYPKGRFTGHANYQEGSRKLPDEGPIDFLQKKSRPSRISVLEYSKSMGLASAAAPRSLKRRVRIQLREGWNGMWRIPYLAHDCWRDVK